MQSNPYIPTLRIGPFLAVLVPDSHIGRRRKILVAPSVWLLKRFAAMEGLYRGSLAFLSVGVRLGRSRLLGTRCLSPLERLALTFAAPLVAHFLCWQ